MVIILSQMNKLPGKNQRFKRKFKQTEKKKIELEIEKMLEKPHGEVKNKSTMEQKKKRTKKRNTTCYKLYAHQMVQNLNANNATMEKTPPIWPPSSSIISR